MKCLIYNALAIKSNFETSPQLSNIDKDHVMNIYLQNSYVSLVSAKENNPTYDVCLFVNFDVPEYYNKLFTDKGVILKKIEFSSFIFPEQFKWALAMFKLTTLQYILNNDSYDYIMMLDTDTYTVGNYDDIISECKEGIVLLNIQHKLSHEHRHIINDGYKECYGEERNISHLGGEFIAGNNGDLKLLLNEIEKIYDIAITKADLCPKWFHDEFMLSVAASNMKNRIIDAGPYIYRYWTGGDFYLVSTNYKNNAVDIWHLPQEKERGMIKLFDYHCKRGRFPSKAQCARIFKFSAIRPSYLNGYVYYWFMVRVKKKIIKTLNKLFNR